MKGIEIQCATQEPFPTHHEIQTWIEAVFTEQKKAGEVVVRIVDEVEMINLNSQFRKKQKSTNVLSFPSQIPSPLKGNMLGDIVICAPVVIKEAHLQNKNLCAHWAHMVVHGVLHLLGYDHEHDIEANIMESHEIKILNSLGFTDPYRVDEVHEQ
ncbi:MAG: rRNA maturation RNase YbeY [Proteobacteria bacterium]|nr:rRNA maturation RNase YbeY [Pseudomonadota bacterium]